MNKKPLVTEYGWFLFKQCDLNFDLSHKRDRTLYKQLLSLKHFF